MNIWGRLRKLFRAEPKNVFNLIRYPVRDIMDPEQLALLPSPLLIKWWKMVTDDVGGLTESTRSRTDPHYMASLIHALAWHAEQDLQHRHRVRVEKWQTWLTKLILEYEE